MALLATIKRDEQPQVRRHFHDVSGQLFVTVVEGGRNLTDHLDRQFDDTTSPLRAFWRFASRSSFAVAVLLPPGNAHRGGSPRTLPLGNCEPESVADQRGGGTPALSIT